MYCTNCGKDIGESSFCPYCGTPKANDEPSAEALKNDEINAEITNDVNIPEQENVSAESADNSQEKSTIYEYAPAQEKPAASLCASCGSEIPEGAPFCTPVRRTAERSQKKEAFKGRAYRNNSRRRNFNRRSNRRNNRLLRFPSRIFQKYSA